MSFGGFRLVVNRWETSKDLQGSFENAESRGPPHAPSTSRACCCEPSSQGLLSMDATSVSWGMGARSRQCVRLCNFKRFASSASAPRKQRGPTNCWCQLTAAHRPTERLTGWDERQKTKREGGEEKLDGGGNGGHWERKLRGGE